MNEIKCKNCGEEHVHSTMNCCWANCSCKKQVCLNCGSNNISDLITDGLIEKDDESGYWCCKYCKDCGQRGCGMCV